MWNVLLVDDDRIVLEGLQKFVDWEAMGYQIAGAILSAEEAVEFIQFHCVDVLITDIMMPREDGFQLIQNALLINPFIKTVILSSYSEFDFAKRAIRLGSFDYLTKPVDLEELKGLLNRLRSALEQEAAERKAQIAGEMEQLKNTALSHEELADNQIGPVIEDVTQYIHGHFNEELTLHILSEVAYVHPAYLSKLFKEKTGENFIDYLTKVRMEKAKLLLRDISLSIYDVSEMVGYSSPKHFSKLFKSHTGMTPKDYRRNSPVLLRAEGL